MAPILASALLVLVGAFAFARGSTDELLQCRANLTAGVRNETILLDQMRRADFVFTGKVAEVRPGRLLLVKVKRAMKGRPSETVELRTNDSCAAYVRRSFIGIFLGRRLNDQATELFMHFGPIPLTLANLDRVNAAVKDWAGQANPKKQRQSWQLAKL